MFRPISVVLFVGLCGCGGAYRAQEFGVLRGVSDQTLADESAAQTLFERKLASLPGPQQEEQQVAPSASSTAPAPQEIQADLFQVAAQVGVVGETANAAAIDVVSNVVDLVHLAMLLDNGTSRDKESKLVLWSPGVAQDLKALAKQLEDARDAQRSAAKKSDAREKLEKLQEAFSEFNALLDATVALLGNGGNHLSQVAAKAGPLLQWMRIEHSQLNAEVVALLSQMPKPESHTGIDIGMAFLQGASGFSGFGGFNQIGPAAQGVHAVTQVTRIHRQPVYAAPVLAQPYPVHQFVPAPISQYAFNLNIARQRCGGGSSTAVHVGVGVRR